MQATTLTTSDTRELQQEHERANHHLHRYGLGTLTDKERVALAKKDRARPRATAPPSASSQCAGCGDAFHASTSRKAIAARREHERKAHGVVH